MTITESPLARFASQHTAAAQQLAGRPDPRPVSFPTEDHENMSSPILKHFSYAHLPPRLKAISAQFHTLAAGLDAALPDCPEKTAGLRKLLEAKDCMVRAAIEGAES